MILYRYIIREHIFPFLASLSIIVFLFLMQWAVILLDRIISKGLDPGIVFEIFVIQLGWIIALAIPMAILSATLMTFGRMSGDNEITAIKASGRSMWPLLLPVFSAATVFMVSLVYFNDLILPDANHRASNLLSDISRKRPAAFIEPGVLIRDFTNYALYAQHVNARSGELRDVKIFSDAPDKDPSSTVATRGFIRLTPDEQYLELTLFDGETHSTSRQDPKSYFVGRFKKQLFYIRNVDTRLQRTNSSYRGDREKSSTMMLADVKDLKRSRTIVLTEFNSSLDTLCAQIGRFDSLASSKSSGAVIESRSPPNDNLTFSRWASLLQISKTKANYEIQHLGERTERTIRRLDADNIMISQYMVEVHKKYAIPVACIIFVLIGAPLGIMARRGGLTVGASYSIFFFVTYWAFLIGGEDLADKMKISPEAAMWSGNILIGLCGIVLTFLMLRETTIRFDSLMYRWNKFIKWEKEKLRPLTGNPLYKIAKVPGMVLRLPSFLIRKSIGILPTYLIRLFSGYLFGVLAAIVVVFVVIDYISNLKRFETAHLTQVMLYYYYYLPWIIQEIIPVVLLLASMFAIGKLAKHSELTAMKSAGINIRQLTFPLLFCGMLIAVAAFYLGEWTIPRANAARNQLTEQIRMGPASPQSAAKAAGREFRRNFFYFGSPKIIYFFEEFATQPQIARGIRREVFDKDKILQRVKAEAMQYDKDGWVFLKGQVRDFSSDSSKLLNFDTLKDTILKVSPSDMVARVKNKEEMSYWELQKYTDLARRRGEQVQKYAAELDFKIALPAMNFIVILLGIAITARAGRKGSAMLFGIGLLLTFSYWIIARFAIVFAENGNIPSIVGAWSSNVLFMAIALLLYRKASR
jgi:lipopolysaccharide export system permease protein